MDVSVAKGFLVKTLADAIKIGACDSRTDMIIKDYINTIQKEMKIKEETVQRLLGEIMGLGKQIEIVTSVLKKHIMIEEQTQQSQKEQLERLDTPDDTKKRGKSGKQAQ